jgi:hypothetical protein
VLICLVRVFTLKLARPMIPSAVMTISSTTTAEDDRHGAVVLVAACGDLAHRLHLAYHAVRITLDELLLDLGQQIVELPWLDTNQVPDQRSSSDLRRQHDVVELVPAHPCAVHQLDDADDRDRAIVAVIDGLPHRIATIGNRSFATARVMMTVSIGWLLFGSR